MASNVEYDNDDENEYFGWAFDAVTKEWVSANKATKGGAYVCTCPDKHRLILKKGEIRRPYFSHLPVFDADRTKDRTSCGGGGESQLHLNAKHKLRELQGQYTTVLGNCSRCGECVSTDFTDGKIEIEVRSDDNSYRYDAVYTGADGQKTALEIWHKHETGFDKVNKTREAGMKLVEFKARDVLDMKPDGMTLLKNHKPDKAALCVDAAACTARIEAMEAARAKAAEERRMEMERQRVQREIEMERQRVQREIEMEAAKKATEERSRKMEEQRRQRELDMEACRQAEEEYNKLEKDRKRKRYFEIMKAQDQEMAEIAKDVYNFKGPMPIPVPSGFVDSSGPPEWEEWWRRYPNGTGPPCPARRKGSVERSLGYFDFTPPGGKRHPGERFVDVLGLVNAGLISEADIGRQRAFTDEELREKMEALASLGIDSMIGC
jgi:hypothetical protein